MDKLDDYIIPGGLRTQMLTSELDGKMYAHYQQDLEPYLEYATALRNDDAYTTRGIKKGWMHAMHISDLHIIQLRGIGIDVFRAPAKEIVAGVKKLGIENACMTTRATV